MWRGLVSGFTCIIFGASKRMRIAHHNRCQIILCFMYHCNPSGLFLATAQPRLSLHDGFNGAKKEASTTSSSVTHTIALHMHRRVLA